MKELKIGEIGVIDGVRVQCIRGGIECAERACAFYHIFDNRRMCISTNAECRADLRSDHTDVYFKKIKDKR